MSSVLGKKIKYEDWVIYFSGKDTERLILFSHKNEHNFIVWLPDTHNIKCPYCGAELPIDTAKRIIQLYKIHSNFK